MQRRDFIKLLGGAAAAWPVAVRAQQPNQMRRIGMLFPLAESDPEGQARVTAFREALQKLGWTEGRNIQIDYRWTPSADPDLMRVNAAKLVGLKPDVIFAGATAALAALHRETRTVPIVFAQVTDPVGGGYVASLARPGGNITGFSQYEYTVGVKWLELLREIAPRVARVAVIFDPAQPSSGGYLRVIEAWVSSFGIQFSAVRNAAEIEHAINAFAAEPNGGVIVLPGGLLAVHRDLIIALAARHRLPAVYPWRYYVTSGGLASYGVDNIDLYRRAAAYVDRILKGESPSELPVQEADKFALVINLKTAKALGLNVSLQLQQRADEVIE